MTEEEKQEHPENSKENQDVDKNRVDFI